MRLEGAPWEPPPPPTLSCYVHDLPFVKRFMSSVVHICQWDVSVLSLFLSRNNSIWKSIKHSLGTENINDLFLKFYFLVFACSNAFIV